MTVVKEKKEFYQSVYDSASSRDGASLEELPASLWQSFKYLFSNKFGFVLKVSLMAALFSLPVIAWNIFIFFWTTNVVGINQIAGLSDNLGVGYPFNGSAVLEDNYLRFIYAMLRFGVSVPCIIIAGVGIGGMFYIVRRALWSEDIRLIRDFIEGIKCTWLAGVIGGLLSGAGYLLMMMNFYIFDAYAGPVVGKVFGLIGSIAVFALLLIYSLYLVSLSATYRMKFGSLLLGALKLTVGRLVSNIFMVIFCAIIGVAVWAVDTYLNTYSSIGYLLLFAFGIYYCVAIATVNTHRQFDRCINSKAKPAAVVEATYKKAEDGEKHDNKKKQPAHYVNPKKGKKKPSDLSGDSKTVPAVKVIPDSVKGGENGLEQDLSVYIDEDEE